MFEKVALEVIAEHLEVKACKIKFKTKRGKLKIKGSTPAQTEMLRDELVTYLLDYL